jgi:hypothetical protein
MRLLPKWLAVDHKKTLMYVIPTTLATVLPFLVGLIVTMTRGKWDGIYPFYASGEFYIYSAALLGPTCFVFFKYNRGIIDSLTVFFFVSGFVAFIASLLYGILLIDKPNFSLAMLQWSSYIILGYTLLVYYYACLTGERRSNPDVNGMERAAVDKIKDSLGGN